MVNVSAQLGYWLRLLCLALETLNVFRASSHYSHALRQRRLTIQSTFWHTCACSKTILQNVTYMWQDTLTLSKHILVCIGQETPYVFEATSWPFANAFLFDFMLQSCWFFLYSWKQCWDNIVLFHTAKLVSCNHNVNTKRSWRKCN